MKHYQCKIQWVFPVNSENAETQKSQHRELHQILNILGCKLLDKIYFRDEKLSIKDSYNGWIQQPRGYADYTTWLYIKAFLKQNPNIRFVEIIKK
jgi:hypothetical protein